MNGNRSSLVWTMPDEQAPGMLALEEADFLARLAQRFGDRVGSFLKCGTRNAYPLSITTIEKPVSDRVVLVGNSAHTLHPVAGQGFNLGLRDVAQLAELLHEAALAGRDPGAPGLLSQYAAMRGPDTRRMERFTDGLVRIFSSDFFPLACARGLGLVAVDLLPPLKRGLVRMTMGLAGRRSRLALGLPLQETP
jgi:2-octaprenyl-6-methoxyphenol hydroxylase